MIVTCLILHLPPFPYNTVHLSHPTLEYSSRTEGNSSVLKAIATKVFNFYQLMSQSSTSLKYC